MKNNFEIMLPLKANLYSAVVVYAVIGFLATVTAWFLPVETLGLQLNQSGKNNFELTFCFEKFTPINFEIKQKKLSNKNSKG